MDALPLALLVALLLVALLLVGLQPARPPARDTFYTSYTLEEPTRPYTPCTGTEPYGPQGARPWALSV